MKKNILNIAFLISSAELEDGPRDYRKTITNYRLALGGTFNPPAIAYIKLPEDNKALLPDVIDFMYDNDVIPIVVSEGFEMKLFKEVERSRDILNFFSQKEIFSGIYTFFVIDGWKTNSEQLSSCLLNAMSILESNDDILAINIADGSLVANPPDVSLVISPSFTFRPMIVRSRDLKIAARWVVDNSNQLVQLSSEQAFHVIFGKFSPHPMKFISYNPKVAHSL